MSPHQPIRTLVIDDNEDMRLLIRLTLETADSRHVVIGEGTSGDEAVALFDALDPDCVVLDVRMPGLDGIEAGARVHDRRPDQPIVYCSAHAPDETLDLRHCDAFLAKQRIDQLPGAVETLVAGRPYPPPYRADAVAFRGASSSRSGQNGGS